MGGKSPKAPPPRDYYKESTDALKAQVQYAPSLFASEAAFRPMYQQLELGGYRNALLGRISEADLSDASRAEYQSAVAKQQEYAALVPQLEARIKAAKQARYSGGFLSAGAMAGASNEKIGELEAQLSNAKIMAMATPQAASYSDRGLMQILEQDIMPTMSRAEAADAAYRREQDIADVERLGRRASDAYLNADPRTKALLETLNAQVQADLATGGRLSADQQRSIEQQARAGFASRGLALGRQSVASELMNTQKAMDMRKQLDRANAATVLGLNKQFTADPFQAILGRQGQAFGASNQQQAFGQGFAANIGPRLFNPESQAAMDINASNQQAIMATNAAKASITAGMYQGIGSAVGGIATGGLSAGGMFNPSPTCWVARAVYGEDNFKWVIFRDWMLYDSPDWFRNAYISHGERFAETVKSNKFIKRMVKAFMDAVISKHTYNG